MEDIVIESTVPRLSQRCLSKNGNGLVAQVILFADNRVERQHPAMRERLRQVHAHDCDTHV